MVYPGYPNLYRRTSSMILVREDIEPMVPGQKKSDFLHIKSEIRTISNVHVGASHKSTCLV